MTFEKQTITRPRSEQFRVFCGEKELPVYVGADFDFVMRLFETARQAAEGGFDNFTSSLFISPYQNHDLMREVAERAAHEFGVQFLYRDFRPYFRDGQNFAREHGFYMQKYCGCVFSEEERYIKPKKLIP